MTWTAFAILAMFNLFFVTGVFLYSDNLKSKKLMNDIVHLTNIRVWLFNINDLVIYARDIFLLCMYSCVFKVLFYF